MTTEIPTTIAAGTLTPREPICAESGEATLFDIPKPLQPLLDDFLRCGSALAGRQNLIYFFFESMQYELIDRCIAAGVGALLYFIQQFAFELYFVRAEHPSPRSALTCATENQWFTRPA